VNKPDNVATAVWALMAGFMTMEEKFGEILSQLDRVRDAVREIDSLHSLPRIVGTLDQISCQLQEDEPES